VDVTTVYLNDAGIPYEQAEDYFEQAAEWAKQQCKSFVSYHIQDTSDTSYQYDFITEYQFKDPKDAVWFELKWKNS
jgi:hypothetical protein